MIQAAYESWICTADRWNSGQLPLHLCPPGTVSQHCFVTTGRPCGTDRGTLLEKWDLGEKHRSGEPWHFPKVTKACYSLRFVFSGHSARGETLVINIVAIGLTEHPLFYKHIRSHHHPCSEELTICEAHKSRGKEEHRHKEWRVSGGLSMQGGKQRHRQKSSLHLTLLNNFYHPGNGMKTEEYIQPRW